MAITKVTGPLAQLSLSYITPSNGGNAGTVSPLVAGQGLQQGAQAKLIASGQPDIIGTNTKVLSSFALTTRFDLTGSEPGSRSVVVVNPDGTTATIADAFTIQQGGRPSVLVDFVGRNVLRGGPAQPYFIVVSNTGNVDSPSGGLWVSVPSYISWDLSSNQEIGQRWQTDVESGFTLSLPTIPTGQYVIVPLLLDVPDVLTYAHRQFVLAAWSDLQ
jgi:hypothetical protein